MNNLEQKIDAIFSRWQAGVCPGGQVVVRKGGQLIYKRNFGYASLEHQIPVNDETVFHVASVSKQVTVMCVLLLQEDGLLSIDDDVRAHLSGYFNFKEPVTIRQLMNNVSGIRDQWELLGLSGVRIVDTITQKDALSIISKQRELNFQPQSEFLYSNSNFTLLADIVEKLSGKNLQEFANERIFQPLGMHQTSFKENYWDVIPNKASSYYDDGTGRFYYSVLNYGTVGATSLNTTVTDFLKWMGNYKKPTICSQQTLEDMFASPVLTDGKKSSYAGGLFVGKYKGNAYIEHGGADAAYRSAMLRFTEADLDIVLFSNTQNTPMKDAAFAVADVVFGHEKRIDKGKLPQEYEHVFNQDEVAGTYYSVSTPYIMTFTFSIKEGKPHVTHPYDDTPLKHVSGNHFRSDLLDYDFFFGENSVLKANDTFYTLQKLRPFQLTESSKYVGRYESDELDTFYDVVEKEGKLLLSHSRYGEQVLYQVDEKTFVINATFTFLVHFDDDGLIFTGNRVRNVRLEKRSSDVEVSLD